MKKLILGFILGISFGLIINGYTFMSTELLTRQGTITKVEKLTPEELKNYKEAQNSLIEARENMNKVSDGIAKSHQMSKETFMEWSCYYEINGEYIIQYRDSYIFSGGLE